MSEVLDSLNIDKSFFVQFGIVLILFFSLKSFLFEKLREVLEDRENKTTGLMNQSKDKEIEALKISTLIEEQIDITKNELSNEIKEAKSHLIARNEKEYSELEDRLDNEYGKKILDFEKELSMNFDSMKSRTKNLANDLVNKISQ